MKYSSVGYTTVRVGNKYIIRVTGGASQKIALPITAKSVKLDDLLGTKIQFKPGDTIFETFAPVTILGYYEPRFDRLDILEPTTNDWIEFLVTVITDSETIQQAKDYLEKLKDRLTSQAEAIYKVVENLPDNGIAIKSLNAIFTVDWKGSILEIWYAYNNAYPDKAKELHDKTPALIKNWIYSKLTVNKPQNVTRKGDQDGK